MGNREWERIRAGRWWLRALRTWAGGGRGSGRWWKHQLSKARRREARARLRGEAHPRTSIRYETECNWKGH